MRNRFVRPGLLRRMAERLPQELREEMGIPSYLEANPAVRLLLEWRIRAVLSRARLHARESPRPVALDYGCGTGLFLPWLSRYFRTVYGADLDLRPSSMMVEERQLDNVHLIAPEELDCMVPEESLTVIICAEVLEHIEDLRSLLRLFERKLRAGGHLVVSLPTENVLYRAGRRIVGYSGDYHVGCAEPVKRLIQAGGFALRYEISLPFPGPLALYSISDFQGGMGNGAVTR